MSELSPAAKRPRKQHELKEWPEFFFHTRGGRKRFQLRRNDRGFREGDELLIREWDPKAEFDSPAAKTEPVGYTGQAVILRVDYIMDEAKVFALTGKLEGYVLMSTSLVH